MPPAKITNRSGPVRHNTKKAKRHHPQHVVTDNINVNKGHQSLLSAIQDLIKKVDEQGEDIKELKRTSNISVGGTTTSSELSTSNHRNITHAGMFPHIRAVTPSQRQNILEGKYINLASLLLDNETIQELKQVDSEGTTMYVKPRDVRLHLDLSIQEFIEAFTIYKNIICETSNRSKEFDLYLQDIIDISSTYKGNVFYQYHKAFAMKVATIKLTRGLTVD
jgi:hypothetical protein